MKQPKKQWAFTAKQKRNDNFNWNTMSQYDKWYFMKGDVHEDDRTIRQLNRLGCNKLILGYEDVYFPNGKKQRVPDYY